MNDLSQLERSSLTTLRIIVDLMAADIVALRSEVKRLKDEGTPPTLTTPCEGSVPSEGTSEPVAWWLRGSEYDTGCDYEYVSLLKEDADAVVDEGATVIPLYRQRQPTLTDAEREAIKQAANDYGDNDMDAGCWRMAMTLRRLLERTE